MQKPSLLHRHPMLSPRILLLGILVTTVSLSGCGGGGGGGGGTVNTAPTAAASAVQASEDTKASSMLNASDANGDTLTYSIVTQASLGTASITNPATGAFTYMPNPNENGADNFTFKANDGLVNSNIATVVVNINPVNDPPTASPGSVSTNENTPASGALVASDAEGDPLTYSIVTNGSSGTAVITNPATGAFTYTPDPGEYGTDVFTFNANDGLDDSNISTVSVTVNNSPTATGSCSTTPQTQTLGGTLGATDLETPALLTYSLNADGSGGTGPIFTAKGGTVTITNQTTGAFTYQPDMSAGDKRGLDSFDYQVSDPDGATDNATEIVIIDQKIMPLGDSITQGTITPAIPVEERVGYRKPLYDTLIASGYTFDFVGSLDNGSAVLVDFDHEGHGGWTAFDIAWGQNPPFDGVYAWLDINPADIILLHAGTNDLSNTDQFDIEDILNEIERWELDNVTPVTVILARIIDRDSINNPDVAAFNDAVEAMANSRIVAGDNIIIVDQRIAVNYNTDMSDNLHPNDIGYANMTPVWFDALEGVVDKCP